MNKYRLAGIIILICLTLLVFSPEPGLAEPLPGIDLQIRNTDSPEEVVDSLKLLTILTVLSLDPAILIMMTSFTRIIVVLGFVRSAIAAQNIPPTQVVIALALFLTFFTMGPVYSEVQEKALNPYLEGRLSQEEAINNASQPIKAFMLKQTREKDVALFANMAGFEQPISKEDLPMNVLVPAFMISELKTAFQMGFYLYIPFLVIDMVVASVLMSMGMFMVPPIIISLPFKILLFVMTDGWFLISKSLLESF
ncbi:MAG: flagellar type III secretion system pore protein FliP [Syntrophomonadaceae bacterium]|nr:flagellar type III secretion system pore protein FliP [Syntrophomonadaceae bacterium]